MKGQDALNPLKGSIPARTDGDRSLYDALSQQAMDDAKNPETLFVPERNVIVRAISPFPSTTPSRRS